MEPSGDAASHILRDLLVPKHQDQNVTIHYDGAPPQPWHVCVCVASAIISVMMAAFSFVQANDAKADIRAERLSREVMFRRQPATASNQPARPSNARKQ